MPSADDRYTLSKIEHITHFALFVVFAIGVHTVESLLTFPIPWIRLGLAHIITLLMLPSYGIKFILGIFLVRVFVGSALVGKLFSPGFLLAFGGGLAATLVMIVTYKSMGNLFSFWGISLLGAWAHNLIQVLLATLLIHQTSTILLLPYFLATALVTGSINGLIANRLSNWRSA